MLDPTRLFTWEPHIDQRRIRADTLVVTLGSYLDAGHAQRLVDDRLLDQLPNRVLGRFDADQLIDYGGRRPEIVFDRDHFDSYAKPEIALHLVTDTDATSCSSTAPSPPSSGSAWPPGSGTSSSSSTWPPPCWCRPSPHRHRTRVRWR